MPYERRPIQRSGRTANNAAAPLGVGSAAAAIAIAETTATANNCPRYKLDEPSDNTATPTTNTAIAGTTSHDGITLPRRSSGCLVHQIATSTPMINAWARASVPK